MGGNKAGIEAVPEVEERMMADITFTVKADNIEQIKAFTDEAVKRALEQCGAVWETGAKDNAPVDTGRLRNSIEHHMQDENTVVVATDVEYATYQEMGTSKMAAHPYIKPSGESLIATFQNIIENELKR